MVNLRRIHFIFLVLIHDRLVVDTGYAEAAKRRMAQENFDAGARPGTLIREQYLERLFRSLVHVRELLINRELELRILIEQGTIRQPSREDFL